MLDFLVISPLLYITFKDSDLISNTNAPQRNKRLKVKFCRFAPCTNICAERLNLNSFPEFNVHTTIHQITRYDRASYAPIPPRTIFSNVHVLFCDCKSRAERKEIKSSLHTWPPSPIKKRHDVTN